MLRYTYQRPGRSVTVTGGKRPGVPEDERVLGIFRPPLPGPHGRGTVELHSGGRHEPQRAGHDQLLPQPPDAAGAVNLAARRNSRRGRVVSPADILRLKAVSAETALSQEVGRCTRGLAASVVRPRVYFESQAESIGAGFVIAVALGPFPLPRSQSGIPVFCAWSHPFFAFAARLGEPVRPYVREGSRREGARRPFASELRCRWGGVSYPGGLNAVLAGQGRLYD